MNMAAILVMWPKTFEQTFIPLSHGDFTWNLAQIGLAVAKEKKYENVNLRDLGQGQWMTLTFDIHIGSCNRFANCIYQLWHHSLQ